MEKEKTIFDYIGQVFVIFGVTVVILNLFCVLFGEDAKEISSLFALGSNGISVSTTMQFLFVSTMVVALRYLFFTDRIIKNMSVPARTGAMYFAIIVFVMICNWGFDWFPTDMWQAWLGFVLSFGACSIISTFTVVVKDRLENKKMQDALERMKQDNNVKNF